LPEVSDRLIFLAELERVSAYFSCVLGRVAEINPLDGSLIEVCRGLPFLAPLVHFCYSVHYRAVVRGVGKRLLGGFQRLI